MAAGPFATAPADGIQRPGKAGAVILDGASLTRRCASSLGAIRSVGTAASLRPAGCRIALTGAARLRLRCAAAFRPAGFYAVRMLPACKASTALPAFSETG